MKRAIVGRMGARPGTVVAVMGRIVKMVDETENVDLLMLAVARGEKEAELESEVDWWMVANPAVVVLTEAVALVANAVVPKCCR